jgi:dTDP-4-amino-4,6-dideoxygalactose transaminase
MLPLYPTMDDADIDHVVDSVSRVVNAAHR